MSHQRRNEEKIRLLLKIEQQRLDLVAQTYAWHEKTARYDRYWLQFMQWRRYWLMASGIVALYGIRHPNRLIRWARRGVGLLGTVNLLRKTFTTSTR